MALNKAKVLKVAEKYVIQGKISHAISEYQKLIKEDPTDLPLVNTLGDLYVRIGSIPEAVKCFTRLAESYDNGGFVVRAIAMYKKVSKIDPAQIQASLRLADLYSRQGLNSESRSNFLQVADHYIKKSDWENAASVLQRVIEVDPDNPSVEGRIADVYLKLGDTAAAFSAFLSSGRKAKSRGSLEEAETYLKKALELQESDLQAVIHYAEVLGELGRNDEALNYLNRIPFHDFNPQVMETSFQIHLKSGKFEEAEKTYFHLVELDTGYLRLFPSLTACYIQQREFDRAVSVISRSMDVSIGKGEGGLCETQLKEILRLKEDHILSILELVKYYSRTHQPQFIPSLLEKAGELYIRNERFEEAASLYLELIQLEPNDPVHRENLRQIRERLGNQGEEIKLPRLVPDMSALAEKFISEPTLKTIATNERTEAGSPEQAIHANKEELIKGHMVEGDLFAGYGLYHKAIEHYRNIVKLIPSHIEAHEKIRDMFAKSGQMPEAAQECLVLANIFTARNDNDNASRNFTLAYQYDPDLHQKPIYQESPVEDHAPKTELSMAAQENSPPSKLQVPDSRKVHELLQEVDFYLDLGFLTEAKNSIDQYLSVSTLGPDIEKRIGRYETMLQAQSGQVAAAEYIEAVTQVPEKVAEQASPEEFETNQVSSVKAPSDPSPIERPADLELNSVGEPPVEAPPPLPSIVEEESIDEMMINLDQELDRSMLDRSEEIRQESVQTPKDQALPLDSAGLEDVFEEFKQDIDEDLGDSDYETHYSLGIAFKEMGLLEEAISEFQKAMQNKSLDVDGDDYVKCCNLLGLCFVEKGLPQVAVKWFTKGLMSRGHSEDTYQALRYDLACAHELAGNDKAALETFLDVYGININYRDVADRIETLKNRVNGQ